MDGTTEVKTLWVGDVEQWMDENYLSGIFSTVAQVANVKLIRDKATMVPSGYGFVEFASRAVAQQVMDNYNGHPLPNATKPFRLNWASFGVTDKRPVGMQSGAEYSVFVGDLAPEVTDIMLQTLFASRYHTVKNAKVVSDPTTGASRGYGFVRFTDENEKNRAMGEMQGVYLGSRPIRTSSATPKKSGTGTTTASIVTAAYAPPVAIPTSSNIPDQSDPTNTTIFIGGLDPGVDEETLRATFAPFGEMVYVKIPASKGCGFVQYVHRQCAENAFSLHGTYIGNQRVRLSWGRSPSVRPGQGGNAASSAVVTPAAPALTAAAAPVASPSAFASFFPTAASPYGYDASSSSYYSTPFYGVLPTPPKEKVIDFTLPPDINEMNDEYLENKEFQFTLPWFLRQHSGIVPEADGPDSLIISS